MNDLEILDAIVKELKTVDHPRFTENMIELYGYLVSRVPEDGFEQILEDSTLSVEQESAILQLKKDGYVDHKMRGIGRGQAEHLVDLRGSRFFELTKQHAARLQIELPLGCNNQLPLIAVDEQKHPMQDSGQRQTFETGAVRDTAEGKSRIDLISPFALEKLGDWLALGAKKYGERNWERGISLNRHMQSLCRHLAKFLQGVDDGEDHLTAVFCNAMFMIHTREMCKRGALPESLLDLPKYEPMPGVHRNKDEVLEHEPDEEFRRKTIHGDA